MSDEPTPVADLVVPHSSTEDGTLHVVAGPGPLVDVLTEFFDRITVKPPEGIAFLLWSNKHSMWWKPGARGYTADVAQAGRYSEAEATHHVVQSAFHGRVDKVTCMVAAPENWPSTQDGV